ncbi:hypothetical protein SNEBB_001220 [Seison nebaliae]|nr:hypothetical protein SNEBB_001220 [Seison nebaliae]
MRRRMNELKVKASKLKRLEGSFGFNLSTSESFTQWNGKVISEDYCTENEEDLFNFLQRPDIDRFQLKENCLFHLSGMKNREVFVKFIVNFNDWIEESDSMKFPNSFATFIHYDEKTNVLENIENCVNLLNYKFHSICLYEELMKLEISENDQNFHSFLLELYLTILILYKLSIKSNLLHSFYYDSIDFFHNFFNSSLSLTQFFHFHLLHSYERLAIFHKINNFLRQIFPNNHQRTLKNNVHLKNGNKKKKEKGEGRNGIVLRKLKKFFYISKKSKEDSIEMNEEQLINCVVIEIDRLIREIFRTLNENFLKLNCHLLNEPVKLSHFHLLRHLTFDNEFLSEFFFEMLLSSLESMNNLPYILWTLQSFFHFILINPMNYHERLFGRFISFAIDLIHHPLFYFNDYFSLGLQILLKCCEIVKKFELLWSVEEKKKLEELLQFTLCNLRLVVGRNTSHYLLVFQLLLKLLTMNNGELMKSDMNLTRKSFNHLYDMFMEIYVNFKKKFPLLKEDVVSIPSHPVRHFVQVMNVQREKNGNVERRISKKSKDKILQATNSLSFFMMNSMNQLQHLDLLFNIWLVIGYISLNCLPRSNCFQKQLKELRRKEVIDIMEHLIHFIYPKLSSFDSSLIAIFSFFGVKIGEI